MKYKNYSDKWYIFGGVEPIPTTTLDRAFKKYINNAKSKQIRIHDLRHSHASLLINQGATILIVSKRLGHSDIEMTLNTYSHMFPNAQKEIIDMLNNL